MKVVGTRRRRSRRRRVTTPVATGHTGPCPGHRDSQPDRAGPGVRRGHVGHGAAVWAGARRCDRARRGPPTGAFFDGCRSNVAGCWNELGGGLNPVSLPTTHPPPDPTPPPAEAENRPSEMRRHETRRGVNASRVYRAVFHFFHDQGHRDRRVSADPPRRRAARWGRAEGTAARPRAARLLRRPARRIALRAARPRAPSRDRSPRASRDMARRPPRRGAMAGRGPQRPARARPVRRRGPGVDEPERGLRGGQRAAAAAAGHLRLRGGGGLPLRVRGLERVPK